MNVRFLSICSLSILFLLFFCGCQEGGAGRNIIDLYVDAVMLKEQDQDDEAIAKLDEAVGKSSNFSLGYSLQGDIYQKMGDYEKSSQAYEKACELNAWSFHDFFNLGKVYEVMKRFSDAVKAYVRACELNPNHLQAHINTARCFNEIEDYENALLYGQRAQQLNPEVLEIQEILGDIYESKKDHSQAIKSYKRALEMDINNPRVMTSLAVAYLKTEQVEPAKELLEVAVELDSGNAEAHRSLAYCYLRLYEKHAQTHSDAIAAGNADKAYLELLVEEGQKMIDLSIDSYLKAINADNKDWDAHRGLGVAYMIKGKLDTGDVDQNLKDKAIQHWRMSLQINPEQPRADRLKNLIAKYRMQK